MDSSNKCKTFSQSEGLLWAFGRRVETLANTVSSDNGKEFAKHSQIAAALNINFYFAKPYHSWQRGANENLNGLIRQYFPKGTDLSKTTMQKIIRGILQSEGFPWKGPRHSLQRSPSDLWKRS